jgi:hypothetical protein
VLEGAAGPGWSGVASHGIDRRMRFQRQNHVANMQITFDIPLSREMMRCVIRALRFGRLLYSKKAETFLFPADSRSGHLVEHKESRSDLSKWRNDLRQTYRTVGQVAGVSELDMHLLMNHSLPGVNAGGINRGHPFSALLTLWLSITQAVGLASRPIASRHLA